MNRLVRASVILNVIVFSYGKVILAQSAGTPSEFRLNRITATGEVVLIVDRNRVSLKKGERAGRWTLVEAIPNTTNASQSFVVLEDYTTLNGHLMLVDAHGVRADLPKTSESTAADPSKLFLGHSQEELRDSAVDLLAQEILAKRGDPTYEEVAGAFAPIRMPTYSFVGTRDRIDKVGFAYGGRTPNFDPAPYDPRINQIRDQEKVLDGIVGGYLPILRFVYPEENGNWTEMLSFAPLRTSNSNDHIQPVWYRVSRIENGELKWARYIDSYHPFPPRSDYDPKLFYRDLATLRDGWAKILQPGMKIDLPDERIANMARFALVREMMTRVGDFPKYGAVDKDYAGTEHDGFPDTFTVDTTGMLAWGLIDIAGRYIDNYFGKFVRDDGSILYRGPEIGQYGRMLTVLAEYVNFGGDPNLLLKRRRRIDGVTRLLLGLRAKAKTLPARDPAYGMIAGWSEADACLDPQPQRYMQPYFSNSTEAARGFRDLGRVWEKIGKQKNNPELINWGKRLQREARELRTDIDHAITRSILEINGESILPAIAGVEEPFHVVVPRDNTDPQYRSYRAYMEMLYSGSLNKDQVRLIVDYRAKHHDTILGIPTAYGYNTGDIAGFLSYGHGYGLIQHDMIREALLLVYSLVAHQYTRGTWTAPETRNVFHNPAAPYCTPAQLAVELLTRWMLVFEDPESETLWIGKAIPQEWLTNGKTTAVSGAPTRWGRISFTLASHLDHGTITADVRLPEGFSAITKLRLRAPQQAKIKSVKLNGKEWKQFDADDEIVTIPKGMSVTVHIEARYQ